MDESEVSREFIVFKKRLLRLVQFARSKRDWSAILGDARGKFKLRLAKRDCLDLSVFAMEFIIDSCGYVIRLHDHKSKYVLSATLEKRLAPLNLVPFDESILDSDEDDE
mmetsp:Transcript_30206/g.49216  ORF Transcript_30206/g.49216 Transcript_30206/m.49216 type:complete len:109 (+) Transcript_30206:268-594(+)